MSVIFSHQCLLCKSSRHSIQKVSAPICPRCRTKLIQSDEREFEKEIRALGEAEQIAVERAIQEVSTRRKELSCAIKRSAEFWPRMLSCIFPDTTVGKCRHRLRQAEMSVDTIKEQLGQALRLAEQLRKPRIHFAFRRQASIEESRAHQDRRLATYRTAITSLGLDRNLLVIRKTDYKRGNPVENHIRKNWIGRISVACHGKCFICGSVEDHTLDHLWLPKNEGGNFAVCVRDARALSSNVLLLCRSCNAAKGERCVTQFIPLDRVPEIAAIQADLSDQMNKDHELRRIARKWYGAGIWEPPSAEESGRDL